MKFLALIVASIFTFSGCTIAMPTITISQPSASVSESTTTGSDTTIKSNDEKDEEFIDLVTSLSHFSPTSSEQNALIGMAHSTCSAITRGVSSDKLISQMLSANIEPESRTGMLAIGGMVAATKIYCPMYSDFFNS